MTAQSVTAPAVTARFRPGDVVRTREANPEGHTRLPRYLCDRRGIIEAVHGVFPLADDRARGVALESAIRETLYTVVFDGDEVWRDRATERVALSADLWDSYLMRDDAR